MRAACTYDGTCMMSFLPSEAVGAEVDRAGLGRAPIEPEVPSGPVDSPAEAGIRSKALSLVDEVYGKDRRVAGGIVTEVTYYGDMTYYTVRLGWCRDA